MEGYKVAIILPAYNAQKTIRKTIESVLSQSHEDFVLYIIDDSSTDNTKEIINEFNYESRVRLISNRFNQGASKARNLGLKSCNEDIICFIDSDDIWSENKLESQLKMLGEGYNLILTQYLYIDGRNKKEVKYKSNILDYDSFLKKKYRVCFSSVCFKRSGKDLEFEGVGHEDFLFLNYLFRSYDNAYIVDETLVEYYVLDGSLSSRKGKAAIWHYNVLCMIFPNRIFHRFYLLLFYIVNAFVFRIKG